MPDLGRGCKLAHIGLSWCRWILLRLVETILVRKLRAINHLNLVIGRRSPAYNNDVIERVLTVTNILGRW